MYIAAQLLLVFLCLYSSFLIKSGLSDGPFSIGGKCVESSIMNDFKMNKVNKQKHFLHFHFDSFSIKK